MDTYVVRVAAELDSFQQTRKLGEYLVSFAGCPTLVITTKHRELAKQFHSLDIIDELEQRGLKGAVELVQEDQWWAIVNAAGQHLESFTSGVYIKSVAKFVDHQCFWYRQSQTRLVLSAVRSAGYDVRAVECGPPPKPE